MHHHLLRLLVLAVAAAAAAAVPLHLHTTTTAPTPTKHGVQVSIGSKTVELAVAGASAFRVAVSEVAGDTAAITSPMVADQASYASFSPVSPTPTTTGIKTAFGTVTIDTKTANLTLTDASGKILSSGVLFAVAAAAAPNAANADACGHSSAGIDIGSPQRTKGCPGGIANTTQATCCAACSADADCIVWVWADPDHPDPAGQNCWLLAGGSGIIPHVGRVAGGSSWPPPLGPAGSITLDLGASASAKYYGAGGDYDSVTALSQTSSSPYVQNKGFMTPHYWTTDGYAALAVSSAQFGPSLEQYPASWLAASNTVGWSVQGPKVDLYLMPAATMKDGLAVYWALTGAPRLLPKYAYGFLACRWGWTDRDYIYSMLSRFRSGNFPLDAWISDFGWFSSQPDYNLPDTGSPTYHDFGYNNVTFPDPTAQLKQYHDDLHLRFGGIRKPRLGNSDALVMAKAKGWLIDQSETEASAAAPEVARLGGTDGRNLNYSLADLRAWYQQQSTHYLQDGVDFWWNDEGETSYFTFYWWNKAESDMLAAFNATKRFFTINRSYSPGMQRLGLAIWTGDVPVSWDSLLHTPGYMMNWILAGVSHVTCDIGGFSGPNDPPDLLVRWYQAGVFLGVMRVHSTISDEPHFPFLYGTAAAKAMQLALNLRYQLLPHQYSLTHAMYKSGAPAYRPMLMEFPDDPNVQEMTDQWMMGDSVIVAPILSSADGTHTDTSRSVYLPAGTWYKIMYANPTKMVEGTVQGPKNITVSDVGLNDIPLFARAGSLILTGPVIQYTDAAPGGPLNVIVFAGADAEMTLVEDDGSTTAYEAGAVRTTTFKWTDATKTLSWTVSGSFKDEHTFVQVEGTAMFLSGEQKATTPKPIGTSGSMSFA